MFFSVSTSDTVSCSAVIGSSFRRLRGASNIVRFSKAILADTSSDQSAAQLVLSTTPQVAV
jgi:hypothetical protein